MSLSIVKAKKKVSCTVCRIKKVKCDGMQPCSRCSSRRIEQQCTYSKPGQVGRPPKNAVWNKLVINKARQQSNSSNICTEFIFETFGGSIPWNSKFINNDSTKNLYYFIDNFFNNEEAILQLAVVRITKAIPFLPDIKMYDLLELYTWTVQDIVNIVINRLGSIPLDNFSYFDSIACAVFQDLALKYFSEPAPEIPIGNPLSTLSSHQSTRLIEAFFSINPHCILLNKTIILQGYWTELIDPLLLCVIYGTTTYLTKLLEGQPVGLWEAVTHDTRNPFLDYAYCLIQKSSTKVTMAKWQAVVLLGLFETVFGFPKRGMATLGLAFLMCQNLGVVDGSFQAKSDNIQAEMANVAFWALFNGTIRGSVDLGHIPHFDKDEPSLDLPPPTITASASYQFEKSSGDARLFRSYHYLLESFYIQTVTCKYTSRILQQLPEVKYNMYHPDAKKRKRFAGLPKPDDLKPRLQTVIQDFGDFIGNTKHNWSKQQAYTIEMVWALYDVQFDFLKTVGPVLDGQNFGNAAYDFLQDIQLTSDDPATVSQVQASIHKIYAMVDKTFTFLSAPINYNQQALLLPRGTIVSVLESATEVLLLNFAADPSDDVTFGYLKMVEELTQLNIWTDWSNISALQTKTRDFFATHDAPRSKFPTTTIASDGSQLLDVITEGLSSLSPVSTLQSFGSPLENQSILATELSAEDELARAAFFDPCATWLVPMTPLAMDLRLLEGIDTYPTPSTFSTPMSASNPWNTSNNNNCDIGLENNISTNAVATVVADSGNYESLGL